MENFLLFKIALTISLVLPAQIKAAGEKKDEKRNNRRHDHRTRFNCRFAPFQTDVSEPRRWFDEFFVPRRIDYHRRLLAGAVRVFHQTTFNQTGVNNLNFRLKSARGRRRLRADLR